MVLRTANTCIDCHDPIAQATWWASVLDDLRDGPDKGWAVLADPEGNEFCVLSASADAAGIARGG